MGDPVASIRQIADSVVGQLGPVSKIEFGFNRESVEWLTGFIERQRAQPDFGAENVDGLVVPLGSFLGECIIAAYGGRWQYSEEFGQWCVGFDANNEVYPFAKVRKQFENGLEGGDSILGLYDVVKQVATGALSKAVKPSSD